MDISPSTAGARPQFATFGPGFIPFSGKSHINQVRHCECLSSPRRYQAAAPWRALLQNYPVSFVQCVIRLHRLLIRLSVVLPQRNTIYFNYSTCVFRNKVFLSSSEFNNWHPDIYAPTILHQYSSWKGTGIKGVARCRRVVRLVLIQQSAPHG